MMQLAKIFMFVAVLANFGSLAAFGAMTKTAAAHAPAVSDAQIESTIRTKLAKSKIGADGFKFHVSRGTVTWEGTTNVAQHKGAATRMAHTAGATGVANHIQVSAAGKAKAMAGLRKAQIKQK